MDIDKYSLTSSDFYDPLVSRPGGKKTDTPPARKVKKVEVVEAPVTPAHEPVPTTPIQESPIQPAPTASIEPPEEEFSAFKGADASDNEKNYCQDEIDHLILDMRLKWIQNDISPNLIGIGLSMLDNWVDKMIQ